jgi:hypothetical protein
VVCGSASSIHVFFGEVFLFILFFVDDVILVVVYMINTVILVTCLGY